ncbi:MAG: membrane-bound lytic murein transglycosylase MltF [Halioglobus sp.]
MRIKAIQAPLATAAALFLLLLLGGCQQGDSLDQVRAEGELRVVTRNSPTTYYQDRNGPTGFEYALASLLARDLGVELRIEPEFSLDAIFRKLRRSEAHLAAAGLTLTAQRMNEFPHSQPYYQFSPQVIYVAGTARPRELADLTDKDIVVLAGSSHAESLYALQQGGLDNLAWREVEEPDSTGLLEMVATRQAHFALTDSNEFEVQQGLYPRLRVAFDLGDEQQLVWFLPPDGDNHRLIQRINALFSRLEDSGEMKKLRELHFGHATGVSRMGSHTFSRNVNSKLPRFRELIRQVASEYQMDWELLAAISYQESHWNPLATSPTGVRGMMMLTLPTARELGVENRLDPGQSLRGGARYLKNIKRRLPSDITDPDLTWFAMAAYNVGMGHLEDARVITQRQGGDPDLWADVKKRLPLLQQSKYYQNTRYGYARGSEPVTYVQNIRHYYNVLQWEGISQNKPRPPVNTDDYLPTAIRSSRLSAL